MRRTGGYEVYSPAEPWYAHRAAAGCDEGGAVERGVRADGAHASSIVCGRRGKSGAGDEEERGEDSEELHVVGWRGAMTEWGDW